MNTIWSKEIISPQSVRSPSQIFDDAVTELSDSGSLYSAEVTPEQPGTSDSRGRPTHRRDLILVSPSHAKRTIATVEYPATGYPATLIFGEDNYTFVSLISEEEFVSELSGYIASLNLES